MKKYLSCYLVVFSFIITPLTVLADQITSNSVTPPPSTTAVNSQINYPATFLWKIEKQINSYHFPTSYLLGTVHIGKEGSQLPNHILQALSQTDTLMTEVNIMPEKEDLIALSMLMIESDSEVTLSSKLGKNYFNKLAKQVDDIIPEYVLNQIKPWAALSLIMYSKPNGYSEKNGIDNLLTEKTFEINKKSMALETTREALEVFSSLPEDKIITMMKYTLDQQTELQAETLKMVNYYQQNKVNELVAMTEDKETLFRFIPAKDRRFWEVWFYDDIWQKRNDKWLPLLQQQIDKEPTLVAVGAAHLFGEHGLIKALQNQGYQVTPVMP